MELFKKIFNRKLEYNTQDGIRYLLCGEYNFFSLIKVRICKYPFSKQIDVRIEYPFFITDIIINKHNEKLWKQ